VAVLAAELVRSDVVAVLIAGAAAGLALTLLLYRMRGALGALRSVGTPPPTTEPAPAAA
jgi:hypothetical protein